MKIFIASSSKSEIGDKYKLAAYQISKELAKAGYELNFGSASSGAMGMCYDAFVEEGKDIYGYTVEKYQDDLINLKEAKHKIVNNTFERSKLLYEDSDLYLILPGGTGTMAELFGILEEKRTMDSKKPLIIFNQDGYYFRLIQIITTFIKEHFNDEKILNNILIFNEQEDLLRYLREKIKEEVK